MKISVFSRTAELLSLAAKVGARGAFSSSVKTRIEQARLIAETLGELKGAAMKAGQMLSLEVADYFPPEAVEFLAKLQNQTSAVPFEVIEQMLKTELGEKRYDFEKLGRTPIAAASIGQVHSAYLHGQKVAIKIQYPGISETIDSDIAVLKKLAVSLSVITGRNIDWTAVFNELLQTLKNEANYEREGQFLSEYAQRIANDAELRGQIYLPEWISSHSTKKVLTMSFAEGIPLREWLASDPSKDHLYKIAEIVLKLFIKEFYEWGVVQTDPNFANFLVFNEQLGLLDFGSTKTYDADFKKDYIAFLKVLDVGSRNEVVRAAQEFHLLDPRESEESKTLFFEFMQQSILPFMFKDGVFDFSSQSYSNQTNELGRKFVMSLKYTPPPSKLLFLHRRLGGTFALLKKMQVQLDVRPYWKKIVGGEYDTII